MSVRVEELPELIAAAVRKAIADKKLTEASLQSLAHHPITIGLIAAPETKHIGAPIAVGGRTLGYVLRSIDELREPEKLRVAE